MDNAFCTVLSKKRLYQALALIRSLYKELKEDFSFHILCTDEETYKVLQKLKWKNIFLTSDEDLSKEILGLKNTRKLHEYCWTLKPIIIERVLETYPSVNRVTYLDSDLFFWRNPNHIFWNQPDCSVLLTKEEKAISPKKKSTLKEVENITGKYNSGFLSFKRDEMGISALKWWKEKCLESCAINPSGGTFGDQKYLDELPKLFLGVCDITTPGVNIGPWNFRKYYYHVKDKKVWINNDKLIFFHFSGWRIIGKNNIKLIHNSEKHTPFIFKIYKQELYNVIDSVEKVDPTFNGFAEKVDLKLFWEI
ncbi:putative nucleotide-diphospho-sugar transferase [Niallia sp. 01092]|uniref:putative nucleotide-diphospho-sugar transferase n=1 Tax=unclassified Niallia TaxID=2837522 RepID=UPI003FD28653